MDQALELARAKDAKERMAGVERLHSLLESCRKPLSPSEVDSLVDTCLDLLKDSSNFRVSQGALQSLASAAVLSGEHLKLHFNRVLPAVVERLGDAKQPVRDAARRLLLTLMEVSSPTIIVERAGSFSWTHKSWRVREEFTRTVTSAITIFASTELTLQRALLPPILQMLTDSTQSVREAAILCIEEMYIQFGPQFYDELQRRRLPSSVVKDINIRLEGIEPKVFSSEGLSNYPLSCEIKSAGEIKSVLLNPKKNSPKRKGSVRELSVTVGEIDMTEKHVDPVSVYSEKELTREVEKIVSILVPEKDWSIRIAAMQRIEALVIGGAAGYPCFPVLLKQLVTPLSLQLSDRRSSIVKQACHLLSFLSKELLEDFEGCAEMLIPALFKLVVITVLVIAESAHSCIKTMLLNCKVSRVLPRIVDCAKNDRSAVLRTRCCEYSLLMLGHWADAPEIQRSADLYEDLIKCCVADAMSEVRSTARNCYRMFAKTWPERAQNMFLSFDSAIQRIINDEDGDIHRRQISSLQDRGVQVSCTVSLTPSTDLPRYGASVVTRERTPAITSGIPLASRLLSSESPSLQNDTERSLESMLHATKQKVTAIESMLSGLDVSEKQNFLKQSSSSFDLGVDSPAGHDASFPHAVTTSTAGTNAIYTDSTAYTVARGKRASERLEGGFGEEHNDTRVGRRSVNTHIDRHCMDTSHKDAGFKDSQGNVIPNFQRPLLRKHPSGRVPVSIRSSFDDNQISLSEMSNYADGPASLQDALTEGLSSSSDWSARVAAFNYLKNLLQQDPRGAQEILQNFEKVMKLFFHHLDDPHHKVAQAALSVLAEIIPAYRKPFESYLDRILYHVFSRLIDPKELVRQLSVSTLEVVSKAYGVDSLLPALLRSLDEQRSPKVKVAVMEFAINSLKKNAMNCEGAGNSGILNLWLAKLTPLVYDKNTKLKEAAISCIISVYSHYDSTSVLNFILCMSVEEQNSLRRALRQHTPRIEVDLINFLQNKRERQRSKSTYDVCDVGICFENGCGGALKKTNNLGRSSSGFNDPDNGKKWFSQEAVRIPRSNGQVLSGVAHEPFHQNLVTDYKNDVFGCDIEDLNFNATVGEIFGSSRIRPDSVNHVNSYLPSPRLDVNLLGSSDHLGNIGANVGSNTSTNVNCDCENFMTTKLESSLSLRISIPQILHQVSNGNLSSNVRKQALERLTMASTDEDESVWSKFFNQILTVVLEMFDDSDSSVREVTLLLVAEMLNKQKESMEDSIEIVIEKLLHAMKDMVAQVSKEAENCLSIILSEYDPFRCLNVIVSLLILEDEKTLVTCIRCLTKLVGRLSEVELLAQLPSFLPVVFDAFGNQSADVRKTVVFCLVDIYIMLGKAFLPYLEGLSRTQLRLVTIYTNRILQARAGTAANAAVHA